jgi:diguanylate cyclase (GGDEF)-like protein
MMLDIRTIVVMLIVSAALMSLALFCGLRASKAAGFAKWNAGLGLFALGWLLIAARNVLPATVGIALADALLLAGLCFQLAALMEFDGRAAPRLLLVLPGPLLFALLLPLLEHYAALTLVASSATAAALIALAWFAAWLSSAGAVRWVMAAVFAAGAGGLMLRALDIWLRPVATPDIFAGNLLHVLAFMLLFAITVTSSLAFLEMQRRRVEQKLRHLATFDPLTELFNRGAFMGLAERELARARRGRHACAILMMDLDHFKRVNDDFGHQAGDRALQAFGAVVRRCIRTEDLAGRYGGEEFCVLLPGAGADQARMVAERIRAALAERPLAGLPRTITLSIGVTLCEAHAPSSLDAAITRADEALYRAKRAGRDRVEYAPAASVDPSALRLATG